MYLEQWENGCITMLLSDKELSGMGLSFQDIDADTVVKQETFRHLLSAVRRQAGWSPEHRIQVEVLPVEAGCLLLLTPLADRRSIHIRRLQKPQVYALERVDDLLDLAASLKTMPPVLSSSLYRFGDGFRLVVYPASRSGGVMRVLSEYGRLVGEGELAVAVTAEHGEPLAIGDGLDQLIRAVSYPRQQDHRE